MLAVKTGRAAAFADQFHSFAVATEVDFTIVLRSMTARGLRGKYSVLLLGAPAQIMHTAIAGIGARTFQRACGGIRFPFGASQQVRKFVMQAYGPEHHRKRAFSHVSRPVTKRDAQATCGAGAPEAAVVV
ncbi:hypothetical protein [Thermomonas sp.]|uniref:hypothetical protein n=1 Tax=Thermomonas sp. TaxID=1971895 RepID=UPI0026388297|nr:hypothetical protein [Thermomonas sp.]